VTPLVRLSEPSITALADALRGARIMPPYSGIAVRQFVSESDSASLAGELQRLSDSGMSGVHIAKVLDAIVAERSRTERIENLVELVWTGPESVAAGTRDTGAVVRELFGKARSSVLVAGYAVYQGKRIFSDLADRMDSIPELRVRMFLNIARSHHEERTEGELLHSFARSFAENDWPGNRVPQIFYDPRALSKDLSNKAALHAKCVVVDEQESFVTSANFTEAAQERNIEIGVLVRLPSFARSVIDQFEGNLSQGNFLRLPWS
jgi:phosphatidylserine/phosphatidylglycerophosphate/cardiolipin synthase-like enzyme